MAMGFFVTVAVIAHILVWMWRPWFPGTEPYKAGMAAVQVIEAPVAEKA
jgi:light-harvesting complex 1 beta chain